MNVVHDFRSFVAITTPLGPVPAYIVLDIPSSEEDDSPHGLDAKHHVGDSKTPLALNAIVSDPIMALEDDDDELCELLLELDDIHLVLDDDCDDPISELDEDFDDFDDIVLWLDTLEDDIEEDNDDSDELDFDEAVDLLVADDTDDADEYDERLLVVMVIDDLLLDDDEIVLEEDSEDSDDREIELCELVLRLENDVRLDPEDMLLKLMLLELDVISSGILSSL